MSLTNRQSEILAFMQRFHEIEDRLPSSREIADHFGFKHQTAVVGHLHALERKGMIEHRASFRRKNGWYRFTRKQNP